MSHSSAAKEEVHEQVKPATAEEFLEVIRDNHETRVRYCPRQTGSRSKEIANALKTNTALTELDLEGWWIGTAGGKELSKFIKVNQTVKQLRLVNNNIGGDGGDLIAFALLSNSSITSFSYVNNKMTSAGLGAIGRHLAKFDRLRELDISVSTNPFGHDKYYLPIAKAIKLNRGLRKLRVPCSGRYDFDALIGSLKVNRTLEKLAVGAVSKDYGLESLHDLRGRSILKDLSIALCSLDTPTKGTLLGEFLSAAKDLTTLSISDTHITAEAMPGLCTGIEKNTSIVRLSMSRCGLKDETIEPLLRALMRNKSLTALNVVNRFIERKGCFGLLNVLKKNRRIQYMSVLSARGHGDSFDYLRDMIEGQLKLNRAFQQEQFLQQLDSDKRVSWQRCRLMMVGQGRAGKTATLRALTNKRFDKEWKSTVGISMEECKTTTKGAWAGGSRGGFTSDVANRLMVEDITKQSNIVKGDANEPEPTPKMKSSVGTSASVELKQAAAKKTEKHALQVKDESESGKEETKEEEAGKEVMMLLDDSVFVETKENMDSIRLTVFDMGGQRVFYTFHHLFLSSNAVYLIIFSLVEFQQNTGTALGFLKHWTESISIHAPTAPIRFVGTFLDELQEGSLPTVMNALFAAFPGIATTDTFTAVSNRTGKGIEELRDRIDAVILAQDFVFTPVSVRWMRVLDLMLQTNHPWTPYTAFREQANTCGISSMAEMNEALKLFHLFGSVLYCDATESLKDLIVHDPQWLVDEVSKVIRDARIHGMDMLALEQAGLKEDAGALLTAGMCSRDLLEFVWKKEEAEYLTSLMQSLLLMSPVHMHSNDTIAYLVPSMAIAGKGLTAEAVASDEKCRVAFEYMHQGVFERIVCMCVSYSEAQQRSSEVFNAPLITLHQGVVWFGHGQRVVIERKDHGSNALEVYIQGVDHVRTTLPIIEAMLLKVKREFMNRSLVWTTQVKALETWKKYLDAKQQRLAPWFNVEESEKESGLSSPQVDAFLNSM